MKKITIKNLSDLENFAKDFLFNLKQVSADKTTIIALSGSLGAGKTTFVQLFAKELDVKEVVTSPTYTILKQYETGEDAKFKSLIHMDAYRLDSTEELNPLRFDEFLNQPNTLMCIEWAEKIKEALPEDVINISIVVTGEDLREITVS